VKEKYEAKIINQSLKAKKFHRFIYQSEEAFLSNARA